MDILSTYSLMGSFLGWKPSSDPVWRSSVDGRWCCWEIWRVVR